MFTTGGARGRLRLAGLPHRPGRAQAQGHLDPDRGHHGPRLLAGRRSSPRDGAHHVNATYYNDVRVPVDMLVGEENEGWRLITTQLNHERVMLGPAGPARRPARPGARLGRGRTGPDGRPLLDRPDVRRALAAAYARRAGSTSCSTGRSPAAASDRRTSPTRRRPRCSRPTRCSDLGRLLEEVVAAARRPGRPGDRRAAALAGRAGQAEPGADLRRRRQRGAARADRDVRPRPAAGAAMNAIREHDRIRPRPSGSRRRRRARPSRRRRDPVNQPMINNWLEAIGDANPLHDPATGAIGAAGDGPGVDDGRAARPAARGDDPLQADDAGARRGRVHLGRGHQLRADLPPLPAARRAGQRDARGWRTWPARSRPRWARAGSSPPGTPGTSATSRSPTMLFRVLKFRPAAPRRPTA